MPGTVVHASLVSACVVMPSDPADESAGAFVLGFGLELDLFTSPEKLTLGAPRPALRVSVWLTRVCVCMCVDAGTRLKELSLAAASVAADDGKGGPDAMQILKPTDVHVQLNQKSPSREQPLAQRLISVYLRASGALERGATPPPIGAVFSYQARALFACSSPRDLICRHPRRTTRCC
jgi:hypothetical protein